MVVTKSTRTRGFPAKVFALALLLVFCLQLLFVSTAMAAPEPLASSNVTTYWTRWASPITSHLVHRANGNLMRVEYDYNTDALYVEEYDSSYNLISSQTIDNSLIAPPGVAASDLLWGGFYEGTDAFWVVTGQANYNEDSTLPVIRVAKFDKNWSLLGSTNLNDGDTYIPFDAGSLRMLEFNGFLLIRTAHEMYASSDGLHHQSNDFYALDADTFELLHDPEQLGFEWWNYGYVSHSFNQFLASLNGKVYAVDHGDAYPRAVRLRQLDGEAVDVIDIPGEIGNNTTGVSVGGFESSAAAGTLLITGNSADLEAAAADESLLSVGARDAWLSVTSSDLSSTRVIKLSSAAAGDPSATAPQLVKVNENTFMAAWNNLRSNYQADGTMSYVFLDGNGTMLTPVMTADGLMSDCKPIMVGGDVVWYTTGTHLGTEGYAGNDSAPVFYRINAATHEFSATSVVADAMVSGIDASYTYTCRDIEPQPVVTRDGETLVLDRDYTVSYRNNRNVGTATVVILVASSEHFEVSFEIVPADIADADFMSETLPYTGRPLRSHVLGTYNDIGIGEGDDFEIVSYENNVGPGTGIIHVRGIGNFTGTTTVEFEIIDVSEDNFGFPDVNSGDWYAKQSILGYALDHGFIHGYDNGMFGPYDSITRGQFVTILHNMTGSPQVSAPAFDDVDYSQYYGPAIRWARTTGVVSGNGDNTFRPDQPVTREELCAMIANYAKQIHGVDTDADDAALDGIRQAELISAWARPSVAWCVNNGIISGENRGGVPYMNPQGQAWRCSAASMVTVLHRDVLKLG